jgi:hypothetical protein
MTNSHNPLQTHANQPTYWPTETQLVRGLANSADSRLELPCLVDQANCGEVYYITWTKQLQPSSGVSPLAAAGRSGQQSAAAAAGSSWSRVYLYTGANDSAPHKPIGDLANRAHFVMPDPRQQQQQPAGPAPLARLVIEEPRLSDEALYKCDVTYVKGKCPSISLVRVQMMALPERAQIVQLPAGSGTGADQAAGKRAQARPLASGQVIGPLNEHDQLRLLCTVAGGRPAPRAVFWRKLDLTGRTINLAPSSWPSSSRHSPAAGAEQPAVEVALNHTLTSADLGAKFECHVEHEALESLRPAARIISASSSSGNNNNNAQRHSMAAGQPDALLDLHPAAAIDRRDESAAGEPADEGQAAGQSVQATTPSLDAHVMIDLNGKFGFRSRRSRCERYQVAGSR